MAFDGIRALIVGTYVTPSSGEYAGQLGPWHYLVEAVGIDPLSLGMRLCFAVYGVAWLGVIAAFLRGSPWASRGMVVAAIGTLWYAPIGSIFSLAQLGLLWLWRARLGMHQTAA